MISDCDSIHYKKNVRDYWICSDQTFLGLGLGKLFPARESFVSDIPAGDGNTAKPFFTVLDVRSTMHRGPPLFLMTASAKDSFLCMTSYDEHSFCQ